MNIAIYIYDQAEVLDFSGPFEVFSTAARLNEQCFSVFFVAESTRPVRARGGFTVVPDYDLNSHPQIDILIVVGGVHDDEMEKANVLAWLQKVAPASEIIASVCTGAFILASAGIYQKQKVTTHWQDIACLREQYPDLEVLENIRWVEDENIISSAGISAGIDMSLHLVARTKGLELAQQTAMQMEYDCVKF